MSVLWNPDGKSPRRVDRAPQPKRHEGPYYGHDLRRVIAPEPTDPSLVDRAFEWYLRNEWVAGVIVGLFICLAASIIAAWIVS